MDRIIGGILVLVLGISVVTAEDEGQDKQPATPEQQYMALLREYNEAFQDHTKPYPASPFHRRHDSGDVSGALICRWARPIRSGGNSQESDYNCLTSMNFLTVLLRSLKAQYAGRHPRYADLLNEQVRRTLRVMNQSDAVIVGPSPVKLATQMGVGGVGVIVGVTLVLDVFVGRSWLVSFGWIHVVVISAVVVALIISGVIRKEPRVDVGPEEFVVHSLFSSRSRRWSDIDGDFTVIKVPMRKVIVYRLTQAFKKSARIKPRSLFAGNDEAISGSYVVSMDELAELLNQHKRRIAGAS